MYIGRMPSKTPTIAYAELVLNVTDLADWITPRRHMGMSFDRLARELARATEGRCRVTGELLRRHFGHVPREPDSGGAAPAPCRRTA